MALLRGASVSRVPIQLITVRNINMKDNKLFVERRPEGDDAVRKPDSERASSIESTQAKAIERAREMNSDAALLVERVRHTTRGKPDKWRKP